MTRFALLPLLLATSLLLAARHTVHGSLRSSFTVSRPPSSRPRAPPRSVSRPRSLLPLFLAASLLLAGCSSVPGGPSTPSPAPPPDVEVTLTNAANATYDMEVLLLPRPAERARVTGADGSTRTVGNLTGVGGVQVYRPTDARGVEPLDVEPLDTRTYRGVGPRSSVSSTFEDPPDGVALFVVVTDADGVYLWATGTCEATDHLTAFDVEIHEAGPGLSIGCEAFGS